MTLKLDDYRLANPQELITPCLLFYPDLIRSNLQEALKMAGGCERLRPHVKTHKTSQIVHLAQQLGIDKHKCATLAEAHMLAECGVGDVLLAYQPVGPAIERLAAIVAAFPETRFSTVVDALRIAQELERQFAARGLEIDVLIDIDAGMHRTGMPAGQCAFELYEFLDDCKAVQAAGLHVYDGHNHQTDAGQRMEAVQAEMQPVLQLVARLLDAGHRVPKLVCGGTPTFPAFAHFDLGKSQANLECSPGTCVLSDHGYGTAFSDMSAFRPAALLMTRVISKHHQGRITLDLGHKAVAGDPPAGKRCHFLGLPDAREIKHNEEHLVVESTAADDFEVGDVLYAVPTHICPTVALHCQAQVVRQGTVVDTWSITARDRFYR